MHASHPRLPVPRRASMGLIAWVAWALAAQLAAVAAHAAAPVPAVRPIYFQHLTMRDGLSQSTVMSILQDSQGYLWLGTESGLDRYDGYSIHAYQRQRNDPQGLPSDYIWSIAEDKMGNLWLATDGGGIARWERATDRFVSFRHDPANPASVASDSVRTLLIDRSGRIWAGTIDQGLDVLDPATGRVRHFRHTSDPKSLANDAVNALYADHEGRIWIGTDGGLSRYDAATDDFVNVGHAAGGADAGASGLATADLKVTALLEDHAGVLWVGTREAGLIRLDPRSGTTSAFTHDAAVPNSLSNNRIWSIMEDSEHRLWAATADGVNLFEPRSRTFVRYAHDTDNPQSLRDNEAMTLYQDRGGVIWVGTRSGGVSHWNPRSWLLGHYRSPLLGNAPIIAFADDGDRTVWVGLIGAGLVAIDTAGGGERRIDGSAPGQVPLPDARVMALQYQRGLLWIGTRSGGLVRLDLASGRTQSYRSVAKDAATLPADAVMALYADRSGVLWVGTFGGGLASIDAAGRVTRFPYGADDDRSLSSGRASAIAEDALGNLWIGTIGGGLNLLERSTGRFHHYRRKDADVSSLSDDTIYALHVDAGNQLWIGTAGAGLDHLLGSSAAPDAVRFENQSAVARMPNQVILGIESDASGRLWMSTDNGLAELDPKSRIVHVFHEAHGLQGEEFVSFSHHRSADGTLFFGGANGFNAFVPERLTAAAPPPPVALTTVAKLNHVLTAAEMPLPGEPIRLGYDDKLLSFEFAALDFTSSQNNRYNYRLQGFDNGWVDAGAAHRATYTNLAAGEYLFQVRAANADGVWSPQALSLPVHVEPAPWNSAAARFGYASSAILVAFLFWRQQRSRRARELSYSRELEQTVRSRTEQLERRNEQLQVLSRAKSDFVARMSHELRTPMNGVLGMTALIRDTRLDATQSRFAEAIYRSAESLLAIVDDVLDFSKAEAGRLQLDPVECDLVELVEQTAEMLAARAAAKNIELLCDSPIRPLPRVLADSTRLRQVLVNLGGNAVKFTERGAVILRIVPLRQDAATLRVRLAVSDTGVGIARENHARIFQEFTQEDASTTRRFGGTGLGLSIARQLVELMGGNLDVDSRIGQGSTFSCELSLPLADPDSLAQRTTESAAKPLAGRRILLAMPNAAARDWVLAALSDWGAVPVAAAGAGETITVLRDAAFDAAIIDDPLCEESEHLPAALHAASAAGLRTLRLRNFASLAAPVKALGWRFDVELTKPLRLQQLHEALAGRANPQGDAAAHAPAVTPLPRLHGRILVVEDHPINREVALGVLSSLGLHAETVNNGREALRAVAARPFDLILMDCEMPVFDGFSATRAIRGREAAGARVPIVALSADGSETRRAACLAAGMDDHLSKPYTREALHATLARWLGSSESGSPAAPASAVVPTLLDAATLAALRALPGAGAATLLDQVAARYCNDSMAMLEALAAAVAADDAPGIAAAAHAWSSYNGNIGAHTLAKLCRELEHAARRGDLSLSRQRLSQLQLLHAQVRIELELELELERRASA